MIWFMFVAPFIGNTWSVHGFGRVFLDYILVFFCNAANGAPVQLQACALLVEIEFIVLLIDKLLRTVRYAVVNRLAPDVMVQGCRDFREGDLVAYLHNGG